jgi:hypothetical protein
MAMLHNEQDGHDWLQDVPQDDVVLFAGHVLGVEKLTAMASRAEDSGNWWLSARHWSSVRLLTFDAEGPSDAAADAACKSLHALGKMSERSEDWDDLRFQQALTIVFSFGPALFERLTEMDEVLRSPAAARNPGATAGMGMVQAFTIPMKLPGKPDMTGEQIMTKMSDHYMQLHAFARKAADSDPDPQERVICRLVSQSFPCLTSLLMCSPSFDWDIEYGRDGEYLVDALRAYDYRAHHTFLVNATNGDWLIACAANFSPGLLRWGDQEREV